MFNTLFNYIAIPFGYVIRFFYGLTDNYLITLFLFAIVVKIVLSPFSIKQQKNSIKQARLKPKENAIRKKYAGRTDKVTQQKLNNEIMELYQTEKVSMFGGCLPLLLQFPIIISLYNVVMNPLRYIARYSAELITTIKEKAVELYPLIMGEGSSFTQSGDRDIYLIKAIREITAKQADAFSGIEGFSISDIPDFTLFGNFDLAATPSFKENLILLLVPIVTFVATFFSMRLTRKFTYQTQQQLEQQKQMKLMDFFMPAMSTWICFVVPAAIGIYWIFNNLLGIGQQALLAKLMPVPHFTEEEYKAAEKEIGSAPAKQPSGKPYRSLHHIDDEESEIPPRPQVQQKKQSSPRLNSDIVGPVKLKSYDRPTDTTEANEPDEDGEVPNPNRKN